MRYAGCAAGARQRHRVRAGAPSGKESQVQHHVSPSSETSYGHDTVVMSFLDVQAARAHADPSIVPDSDGVKWYDEGIPRRVPDAMLTLS